MEDENSIQKDIFLSTVLYGTRTNNKTFGTLINTGSSASLMSNDVANHLQQVQLGKIKKSNEMEWSTQVCNFQTTAIITPEQ